MKEHYLVDADLRRVHKLTPDVLVIGGGAAGLSAALSASEEGASVVVASKSALTDTNTAHAQGGVAAALGPDDSPEAHLNDTIGAGAGLTDEDAARLVVTEGPERIRALLEWGTAFDRNDDGTVALTREAAHAHNRILHANGDATGREIQRLLTARASDDHNITVTPEHFVIDLLHHEGSVHGALMLARQPSAGGWERVLICAKSTILATGGAGRLFRETTNPEPATGDGIALAYRAGARLADLEFVQFHPTALYLAGAPRLLISEAVRGEGAHLLNTLRERFMVGRHPQAELAPRDVVSVAVTEEMRRTKSPHVYLDLRHLPVELVMSRFPGIATTCGMFGLSITRDLIPVRPAAHYVMGGVMTDLEARTSLEGLFAAGEVACTGLHGANRLASNSLLEGLVFGWVAGRIAAAAAPRGEFKPKRLARTIPKRPLRVNLDDVRSSLQALMTRQVGVFRNAAELESALRAFGHWRDYVNSVEFDTPGGLELQNMLVVATLITHGALVREESRGGHRRVDFPDRDDASWRRRIEITRAEFEK